ncbi:MAG: ribosome small subunit-dependent GTPase A [Chloroflexi bacterium]|nr:ribosome small subunit-dependent GTPase A [Chloroflexota bacterium]
MQPGLIIKAQSGFFTVHTENGPVVCQLRGKLKRGPRETDLATVGDRVMISVLADGSGAIESVAPRDRALARRKPSPKGRAARAADEVERESVILANPDQAVFVFACAQPAPRLGMLDRFLVVAEANGIPAIICANKADLVSEAEARELFAGYEPLGYRVIYTSAYTSHGVAELKLQLAGRISALAGPSGVGKSSLLNALQPGLGLAAKTVSRATQKGRHTTVHPELIALSDGGWVADTPGIRALTLHDIDPYELDGYFPDIRPYVSGCGFNDCTHVREEGCAVRSAVARGEIRAHRYESYLKIRSGQI